MPPPHASPTPEHTAATRVNGNDGNSDCTKNNRLPTVMSTADIQLSAVWNFGENARRSAMAPSTTMQAHRAKLMATVVRPESTQM